MKLNLQKSFFTDTKQELVTHGQFTVTAFRYASGVEALEVQNEKCSFIFTPFKGQQIWHFIVDGKEISMDTPVKEPQNTMTYLKNYGGFLYHCGVISFGAPDAEHPHHGEIPNEEYSSAYICCDEDENGKYICLGGDLFHNTAFVRKYKFSPELKLYENSSVFKITVRLENQRSYPMEYMYLCHINFRPMDGAKLIYSAKRDAEHIKLYRAVGDKALDDYMDALEKDFSLMDEVGAPGQCYDPEICFGIKYEADETGRAYTMQYTDEGACYVSHPTDVLSNGVRWISRTNNEQAMGMVLPATAEHIGYENAKNNDQLKVLGANETLEFYMEAGFIEAEKAKTVKEKIEKML
ncbi:MAG: DUF4432 family protein [Ruminococcaceae bacterium]|nr:DUF4432 family protein [Oscillospiraceae bacterium]